MRHFFIASFLISVFFTSCTFQEEYSFKSDWSGTYNAELDMAGIADIGGEGSETEELIPTEEIQKMESQLNAIEGISNAKVTPDNETYKILFSYDFTSLEALNLLNSSDLGEESDSPFNALGKWEMKNKGKKKFYMTMIGLDKMHTDSDSEEAKQVGEMLQVTTTLTFHKKVKNVVSEVALRGNKNNQVIINYSGKDMMEVGKNWDVEVKL